LNKGIIEQVGSPLELYNKPNSVFVAGFIGSPKMNLIGGPVAARFNAATIGIRPEHLALVPSGGDLSGTIVLTEHLGSDSFLHVDCGEAGRLTVRAPGDYAGRPGDAVSLSLDKARIHRFDSQGKVQV
jgi:multiple sugar transport system ATP-binding protein